MNVAKFVAHPEIFSHYELHLSPSVVLVMDHMDLVYYNFKTCFNQSSEGNRNIQVLNLL